MNNSLNIRISTLNLICKSAHLIRVLQEIINILKEKTENVDLFKCELIFVDTKSYGISGNVFAID